MRGAVAAGHEQTARAGADVLARGGNAVDAVVAAAAMSWAAEPALTGPCGGGFGLVRPVQGRPALVDAFTSVAGMNLPPTRHVDPVQSVDVPFDERTTQVFHIGPATCAVPGIVPGLAALHARYGSLAWRDLLLPAAAAADGGVVVNQGQYAVFKAIEAIVTSTSEARELFAANGRFLELGDNLRQPQLAQSIELIAERGAEVFRDGELARAMVAHQAATGGPLTLDDLAAQRPVWRRPLRVEFRGHQMVTNPPPSSGGALIGFMLTLLNSFAPAEGPVRAALLTVEAMRAAGRERGSRFERLLHRGGLRDHLSSAAVVAAAHDQMVRALEEGGGSAPALVSDHGTTHISVVDGRGNAAALTASNGSHSGVVVPGTGLHLNNMAGEEDLAPARVPRPGTRLTSMQAPTVVEHQGQLRLVVGSSGSNRLRSAILQVIVGTIDRELDVVSAVAAPRVHVEGDRVDCEGGVPAEVVAALRARGDQVNTFGGLNLYFGGANAVGVTAAGLEAAGDPRRDCFGLVL